MTIIIISKNQIYLQVLNIQFVCIISSFWVQGHWLNWSSCEEHYAKKTLELYLFKKTKTFSMHHDKGWQVHKAKVGKSQFIAICLQSFVEVSPPCHCGPDWRWRGTIGVLTSWDEWPVFASVPWSFICHDIMGGRC